MVTIVFVMLLLLINIEWKYEAVRHPCNNNDDDDRFDED